MARYLEQVIRAFSGFSYQTGTNGLGAPQTLMVPCHAALTNKLIATIRANASENILNSCPQITVWQSGLTPRKEDVQNPDFIEHLQVAERKVENGKYTSEKGNMYSVDRLMPMPVNMDVQVDLWTSNQEMKHQLVEQILTVTQYQFQIQNSDNALDWSASTWCFVDDWTWSSLSLPIAGNVTDLDIFTMKLRIPMYLNPPAKVKRISRIEQVVAPLVAPPPGTPINPAGHNPSSSGFIDEIVANIEDTTNDHLAQTIVTPNTDFWVMVNGSVITLRSAKNTEHLKNGQVPSWADLLKLYGTFNPTVSQIRLSLTGDIEGSFVVGTLQYGSAPNELIWTINIDTLPGNTMPPIDAIIDPLETYPGHGLPVAANGQRYMLTNDVGNSIAWGSTFSAEANDIIEYNSGLSQWVVVFNSCYVATNQYVLNLHDSSQIFWTGTEWEYSINKYYAPGYWRITL